MASVDRSTAPAKLAATSVLYAMNLSPMGIEVTVQERRRLQASPPELPLCCLTSRAARGAHHGELMPTEGRAAEVDCCASLRVGVSVRRTLARLRCRAASPFRVRTLLAPARSLRA